MNKIRVGIVGAAGYTSGELLRILLNHPNVSIAFAQSSSNANNLITKVHRDLLGETLLTFSAHADYQACDVLFLCMGHGKSVTYVEQNDIPSSVKIIDLSNDYRLKNNAGAFIYGLPELNRSEISTANYLANPGCFATAIQLAVLPLAASQLLKDELHVHAITGSTGAGQAPNETSHFSWRAGNVSAYKAFKHQHLDEIKQSFKQLQSNFNDDVNFIPIRGNHTRGIFASVYTKYDGTLEDAVSLYSHYYAPHPFVFVSAENPDVKQVINTNKAVLYLEKHNNKLMILSVIDNLTKGASGQAVQNMNLMFGLKETTGLNLKPVSF